MIGGVIVGLLASVLYTVFICYAEGGTTFRTWALVGAPLGMYEGIAKVVADTDRTVADPGKIGVWVFGGMVGAGGWS